MGQRQQVAERLKEVQPLVDQAQQMVNGIDKSHLDFLKNLPKPPQAIHDVMKGVIRVFGQTDSSWNNVRKFLGGRNVKD